MASTLSSLLNTTAQQGQAFYSDFFRALDARQDLATVGANSAIVWNGTPLSGHDALMRVVSALPPTKHDTTNYNVHPLPNCTADAINMVIQLSGRVNFGRDAEKDTFGFAAVFMVQKPSASAPFSLQTMNYRLVHKPANPALVL